MNTIISNIVGDATRHFEIRASLLNFEALKWLRYTGHHYNSSSQVLTLRFKTSVYGIGFSVYVERRPHLSLMEQTEIDTLMSENFTDIYDYFNKIKDRLL